MIPGEIITEDKNIVLNENKNTIKLIVDNKGDRPIQVGSHFHFFEVNKFLVFDREKAFGYRLDIPSGTSIPFEPGESKPVQLVEFGGNKVVYGFNDITCCEISDISKEKALKKAEEKGFIER